MTAKLHEIIAVEGDRLTAAKNITAEAVVLFTKKLEHFRSEDKVLTMLDEAREVENQHTSNSVVTTVDEKLSHVLGVLSRAIDVTASKEATNTLAKADLIVGGDVLAKGVPATALLTLETTLVRIRDMYNHIPTHDPTIDWEGDGGSRAGIYKSPSVKTFKTDKVIIPLSLAKATAHHPEQVQAVNKDVVSGTYKTVKRSGMYSPRQKADVLSRIGTLISAAKQARQRANMQEVVKLDLGKVVTNFISG